jgi:hypothetical protein
MASQELQEQAQILEQVLGQYSGDVLMTAAEVYPDYASLERVSVSVDSKYPYLSTSFDELGNPVINVSPFGIAMTAALKARLKRLFQIPESLQAANAPNRFYTPMVFAHELGHVLQRDDSFDAEFGGIDETVYVPELDFTRYFNSDREVNADFIAVSIISRSTMGVEAGMSPPAYPPALWREWASDSGRI